MNEIFQNPVDVVYSQRCRRFTPQGNVWGVGNPEDLENNFYAKNPPENFPEHLADKRKLAPSQSARIFLGFNIGDYEGVKLEDVIEFVWKIRRKQVIHAFADLPGSPHYAKPQGDYGDIGASFLLQKGLWQDRLDDKPAPENGVQIIILNNIEEDWTYFEVDMEYITEQLAIKFQQYAVICELKREGQQTVTVQYGKDSPLRNNTRS